MRKDIIRLNVNETATVYGGFYDLIFTGIAIYGCVLYSRWPRPKTTTDAFGADSVYGSFDASAYNYYLEYFTSAGFVEKSIALSKYAFSRENIKKTGLIVLISTVVQLYFSTVG